MTRLLISVNSADEALLALAAGADIIDGKDAAAGPLAALPENTLRDIVAAVGGRRPVSATAGDWPAEPDVLLKAAERIAATGVDWVKVGFYPGGDWSACMAALAPLASRTPLVALLFADHTPMPHVHVAAVAAAGFGGVMLDTADKHAGGLRSHISDAALSNFVAEVRRYGLLNGLAGSLRIDDIPALLAHRPDVLGFRGAACRSGARAATLDPASLALLREALDPMPADLSR